MLSMTSHLYTWLAYAKWLKKKLLLEDYQWSLEPVGGIISLEVFMY